MEEERRRFSEINDLELLPDFAADMGISRATLPSSGLSNYNIQHNNANADFVLNNNPSIWQHPHSVHQRVDLNPSQLLQNQLFEQRQNIDQFSMQSYPYPNNSIQNRQMQASSGFERQTGFVTGRAHPELLHMSAFRNDQNVNSIDQTRLGNQSRTVNLRPLQGKFESASNPKQHELTNSIDWINQAYYKILQMKEICSPDVITLHGRAQETRRSTNDAATMIKCENIRMSTEKIMNFLSMSPTDISRWPKEKLYHAMNDVIKYASRARASNTHACNQNQQRGEPNNCIRLENIIRFDNSSRHQSNSSRIDPATSLVPKRTGFDQRALEMFLSPTQLNNKNISGGGSAQSSVTNVSTDLRNGKQANDQTVKRRKTKQQVARSTGEEKYLTRFLGLNQRLSGVVSSPQNSQQSSSEFEVKDLSSLSSKLAPASAASPSGFPSPLTPSAPPRTKAADRSKSPLSMDENNRALLQNSVRPPLQGANKNLVVPADRQGAMDSGANKQLTLGEQDDPVKRLVDLDMDDVTTLTDRTTTNFLDGDSTKVVLQDLTGDISKFRTQSTTKDQMEFTTLNQMGTETSIDLLLREIKEINRRFMEVKVDVMNIDDVSRDEGVLVRCTYVPVGPASQQMIHKLLLELTVPANYPSISPIASNKMPLDCGDSEEGKLFWTKAKSSFSLSLRKLLQPITVKKMASAWEVCAREAFLEYAEQIGGGSFSTSGYGQWQNFTGAF